MSTTSRFARLLAVVLIGFCHSAPAAKPNLNPEHGDPAYREFSVFSPDADGPENYRDDVVVVLHGFMSAVPNGTFKRIRKKLLASHTALGLNYNPLDVDGTRRFLAEVHSQHLTGRRVVVVGTSLGGFWARYLGHLTEAHRVVMLNPITKPTEQLAKYIGVERENPRRQFHYAVTRADLAPYDKINVVALSGPPTLLIVTEDDEQLVAQRTLGALRDTPGLTVQIYPTGGHTINLKKHPALQRIADFVAHRP